MISLVKWVLGSTLVLLGVGAVIVTGLIYFPIWLLRRDGRRIKMGDRR